MGKTDRAEKVLFEFEALLINKAYDDRKEITIIGIKKNTPKIMTFLFIFISVPHLDSSPAEPVQNDRPCHPERSEGSWYEDLLISLFSVSFTISSLIFLSSNPIKINAGITMKTINPGIVLNVVTIDPI